MTQLDIVLSFIDEYIDRFSAAQIRLIHFAFWHDVKRLARFPEDRGPVRSPDGAATGA